MHSSLRAGLAVGAAMVLAAAAQAQSIEFNISPQPLAEAIGQFGLQTGLSVVADSGLTAGKRSAGVRGRFAAADALALLLRDTGLEGRVDGRFVTIVRTLPMPLASEDSLPEVSVTASAMDTEDKDSTYRSAGSTNVLTRDEIELFRGTSVGDIFKGTAGVLVGENRNSGGLDVNIRGMQGQGRVPVIVDGARQETTVYRGYAGVASRSYVDPDLIGGIQIDKGPVMGAQGTGATGGLVSMRTINADDIVRPGKDFGLRVRAQAIGNNSGSVPQPGTPSGYNTGGDAAGGTAGVYRINCVIASLCQGPFDIAHAQGSTEGMNRPGLLKPKSWAGSVALAKRLEAVDLVAAYAQRRQGNYYAGTKGPAPYLDLSDTTNRGFYTEVRPEIVGATRFRAGERIANTNYESKSTLLKGKLYLADAHELELSYLRYDSTYGELMPSQLIWLGQVRQTSNSEVTANTYAGRYRWNPADDAMLDLRANLWHTDTTSLNRNYSEGVWSNMFDIGTERYKRWGADLSNSMQFDQWGGIKLDYGLAYQTEKVHGDGDANSFSAGGRAGSRKELSLFTSAQWKPAAKWTLEAGIRHTRFQSQDDKPRYVTVESDYCVNPDAEGDCDPVMMKSRRSGSAPLLSLQWEPRPGLQVYGRYAEALRMPSLFETTAGFSVAPSQDIHLKPEHTRNKEIGIGFMKDGLWRSSDKFRAKLAYFRNHTKDYLTRTIPNTWEEGSGSQFFTLRNIESVSFHGVELSGSYDMGRFFTELSGTKYTFVETCHFGSYRRMECTDYGIAASYVNNMIPPKWHASATVGTRLMGQKLTLGARGTFMGQRKPTPEYNAQGVDGGFASPVPWHKYTTWDLFATYKINDRFSVDFNIDNLTDQYYLDALSLGLVPAPGRSARLSVTWLF
ncbi:TonB-dependent receptor [Corticibacter populi]|uniref:TonB-dependent receptor n=1 Tax=Corticibacter populi TaxID=1550736 RepID=A0A3M6QK38_9BURK|nr:TonB-dependent receptor [Corticibacter populi]RMX03466.1 TonB-dependent receptor [Corticibacter populi]RZS29904.1 hemoglobin/transferrin/lactoferrin receptor protein [Corticibacter populi]